MAIFYITSTLVQKLACQFLNKCTCHMKNCHIALSSRADKTCHRKNCHRKLLVELRLIGFQNMLPRLHFHCDSTFTPLQNVCLSFLLILYEGQLYNRRYEYFCCQLPYWYLIPTAQTVGIHLALLNCIRFRKADLTRISDGGSFKVDLHGFDLQRWRIHADHLDLLRHYVRLIQMVGNDTFLYSQSTIVKEGDDG